MDQLLEVSMGVRAKQARRLIRLGQLDPFKGLQMVVWPEADAGLYVKVIRMLRTRNREAA